MVLGESGQYPPRLDCIYNNVSFLNRILNMNAKSLVNQVYMELQRLQECGFNTWCSKAWELVHNYNLNIELNHVAFNF